MGDVLLVEPEEPAAWRAMKSICRSYLDSNTEFVECVARDGFDWGALIDYGIRHRATSLIAYKLVEHLGVGHELYLQYFRSQLRVNQHRNGTLRDVARTVLSALDGAGVQCAVRKGLYLSSALYQGTGARYFNDLDIAVRDTDRNKVDAVMVALGYKPKSVYDHARGRVSELDRKAQMLYEVSPDHLPPYTLETNDAIITDVTVDFATSLSWTNSEYPMDICLALDSSERYADHELIMPVFAPAFTFADTIMHLFRESYLERFAIYGDRINKYVDVLLLWKAFKTSFSAHEAKLFQSYNIVNPLLWVFHHMDEIFATSFRREAVEIFGEPSFVPRDYFKSYQDQRGRIRSWEGTMSQRLMAKDRRSFFRC